MKKTLVLFAIIISSVSIARDIAPTLRWFVDVERPAKYDIVLRRGETVLLQANYRNFGQPVDLTPAHEVTMRYAPRGVTNWYYSTTGTVANAKSGTVELFWNSALEGHYDLYAYEIIVQSTESVLLRSYGTLYLTPSIFAYDGTSGIPQSVTSIDWAKVEHINRAAAPFLSDFEIADLQDFDESLREGTADLSLNSLTVKSWDPQVVTNIINDGDGIITREGGTIRLDFSSASGGASALGELTDVTITSPSAGETIIYESGNWRNGPAFQAGENLTSNRLLWVVNGQTIGYVNSNGITMIKGSLQLHEEDLNCNVFAYDGSRFAPSISFFAQPSIGWYRKSYAGDYAWTFAANNQDVLTIHSGGIQTWSTNKVTSYTFEFLGNNVVGGTNATTETVTVITGIKTNEFGVLTGVETRELNFAKGLLMP